MDCEKLQIAIAKKIAISQLTQFIFLSAGRNRNITQFDFLVGRIFSQFDFKSWIAISQLTQFDFRLIL